MSSRTRALTTFALSLVLAAGCAHRGRAPAVGDGSLDLERVILYRNGIGYFERRGEVDGDALVLQVRKDQVNDVLKSLTVVDRASGRAVSVSMPLDPQGSPAKGDPESIAIKIGLAGAPSHDLVVSYVVAAPMWKPTYRIVLPEAGSEAGALLQGWAVVDNTSGEGWRRVAMSLTTGSPISFRYDLHTPREVVRSDLTEAGVARSVAVAIGEATVGPQGGDADGDGIVDAVDRCPDDPETRNGFEDVDGCPDAIPEQVNTFTGVIRGIYFQEKRSRISAKSRPVLDRAAELLREFPAVTIEISGHTTPDEDAGLGLRRADEVRRYLLGAGIDARQIELRNAGSNEPIDTHKTEAGRAKNRRIEFQVLAKPGAPSGPLASSPPERGRDRGRAGEPAPAVDAESLRRSTLASASARSGRGVTRFDLQDRVTVPESSSTMLAIVNQEVAAEQTFLFRPGGAGRGFEHNPYRVVRFMNSTPYALEPGPISLYAGGSFVGEGLSEAVGAGMSATIPFAVEPTITVSSSTRRDGEDVRLVRLVRGILEAETFQKVSTTWTVQGVPEAKGYTVFVRHPKQGGEYRLRSRIAGIEELPDAYLVPVPVAAGASKGTLEIVEQTPSTRTLEIWDGRVPELLDALLKIPKIDPEVRQKLEPVVQRRQAIGRIDAEVDGLRRQQGELLGRSDETRDNLAAIQRDPRAGSLRSLLNKRLEEIARESDALGRQLVELQSRRLAEKIALEDALQGLDLALPRP
ncbi:MAG: OmpA family protein [Nannocystaceae bacterium]